jgi:folate-binding protein YgfZ
LDDLPGYQAALAGAVYRLVPTPGTLRIQGEDRLAFFQRQTTNDVSQLTPELTQVTVLTSPAARILDVLRLLLDGDSLDAVTLPGHGAATAQYLKSRIFFMDKVRLFDLSEEIAQIDLEGPAAAECLPSLGLERIPNPDELITANIDGIPLRVINQPGLAGRGYCLLILNAVRDLITAALIQKGAKLLPESTYHVLRLEAGLPSPGAELIEDYTPLEVGLNWTVAENKGCYTGQEVIARQITYDKVTQRLAGLRVDAPASPGARVWAEGKPAGVITSAAQSPRFGQIALGVLKRPYHQPGTRVQVGDSEGKSFPGIISNLPF